MFEQALNQPVEQALNEQPILELETLFKVKELKLKYKEFHHQINEDKAETALSIIGMGNEDNEGWKNKGNPQLIQVAEDYLIKYLS